MKWGIEGGDEFGYENVITTHFASAEALLLAVHDEDEIEQMVLAYSPKFQSILRAAEKQIRVGKGIQHEDFWREIESEK